MPVTRMLPGHFIERQAVPWQARTAHIGNEQAPLSYPGGIHIGAIGKVMIHSAGNLGHLGGECNYLEDRETSS